MPYTADDCSRLCWPGGGGPSQDPGDHRACERELMDFSDPAKQYGYCACECHHVPGLPGFDERTSGRGVSRDQALGITRLVR